MKTTSNHASETYAAYRGNVARLMDVLQLELDQHAEMQHADSKSWTYSAELARVQAKLTEAILTITSMTEADIAEFLADAI